MKALYYEFEEFHEFFNLSTVSPHAFWGMIILEKLLIKILSATTHLQSFKSIKKSRTFLFQKILDKIL